MKILSNDLESQLRGLIKTVYPKAKKLKDLTDNPSYKFHLWMDIQNKADEVKNYNPDIPIYFEYMKPIPKNTTRHEKLPMETLIKIKTELNKKNEKILSGFNNKMALARKEFNDVLDSTWHKIKLIDRILSSNNPDILSLPNLTHEELSQLAEIFALLHDEYSCDVTILSASIKNKPALLIKEHDYAKIFKAYWGRFKLLADKSLPSITSKKIPITDYSDEVTKVEVNKNQKK